MAEYVYEVTDVPASGGPTPWQTVGPFFHYALPYPAGGSVVGRARPGAFTLHGYVYDGEGTALPDALVEVWQADEAGQFLDQPGVFAAPVRRRVPRLRAGGDRRGRALHVHDSEAGRCARRRTVSCRRRTSRCRCSRAACCDAW